MRRERRLEKSLAEERRISRRKDLLLITTTDLPPGYKLKKVLGLVWGTEVRTKGLSANIVSFFRTFIGGGMVEYANLMREAKRISVERMVDNALEMGGNAVIGVRMSPVNMSINVAEFTAYGTAVVVEKV